MLHSICQHAPGPAHQHQQTPRGNTSLFIHRPAPGLHNLCHTIYRPTSLFNLPILSPFLSSPQHFHFFLCNPHPSHLKMASRPQNIGIKAIEIYFPSQVGASSLPLVAITLPTPAPYICAL